MFLQAQRNSERRNAGGQGLASYQAGTPGPAEAERLILQNGRAWRALTEGC